MNLFDKVYENVLSFVNLFVLNSHNLCSRDIYMLQDKKLRKLMKRAYRIPFYRNKFDSVGLKPTDFNCREDLVKFPVLHKNEIKAWLTPEVDRLQNRYHVFSTSGSTGSPLKVMASPKESSYLTANWLRMAMKQGINPFTAKTLALKDPKIVAEGKDSIVQKFGLLRRKKVSFLADGKELVEALNDYQPDFFYVHKTKLLQMIEYAERTDTELYHPAAYAVISEMISTNDEKLFRKYLGDNIYTSYGCMETGACTFTPKGSLKKHIITNDTHIINVVGTNGELSNSGKMLLTNLNFRKFPIINYDVGDNAETYTENGVEYISMIHGRVNDWIELDDGRRYDYHPFYRAFEGQNKVLHFRVIQNEYHSIQIQLVGETIINEYEKKNIETDILAVLNDVIVNYDMKYVFDWKEKIEPDKNGKTRFIVNNLKRG